VFLCTIDVLQSSLVCCHNDTLACGPYMVLIISSVSGIVNVMCLVIPAAVFLIYFVFFGTHYNSSVASVKARLQNVKSQYQCAYCYGTITGASGNGGYFPQLVKYQNFWNINSVLKELYCVFCSSLRCIKYELWCFIGDLNFPIDQWFSMR
jgi:hypothetical protein